MIKETFEALKSIGVEDSKILDLVVAIEERHRQHDIIIEEFKRDLVVMKWAVATLLPLITGLVLLLLGLQLRE